MSTHSLSLAEAREVWSARQKLGRHTVVTDVAGGWVRSLGGVDPYLALFARTGGLRRSDVDAALADGRLWVVPGVRGCIWLVPDADRALALRVSEVQARRRNERDMEKLEVPQGELAALANHVVAALEAGPMSPDALRDALPEGSVRRLGAAGKKIGHNTTLPTALRQLEWAGKLRRIHVGGRVDTSRYEWALSEEDLVAGASGDAETQAVALARRYFDWAGPASLTEFVEWTGVKRRDARAAIAALELDEVRIESRGDVSYVVGGALDTPPAPDDAVYLLPAQDNHLAFRDGLAALVDPRHHDHEVVVMGGRTQPLGKARWVIQRPIVHRGALVGFWEYDPDAGAIVYAGLDPLTGEVADRVAGRASALGGFITAQLDGAARSLSTDSDKAIEQRVDALRALA